ncbi:MAG: protein phosphatase 2C domain-containing protein [Anaerolineae bacterium]|jgi:serine/threonine protein phosphatase PrpC|nr:protein phosphatase 2C domain-containing protein [Anaerolineae bacterium]
MNKVGKWFRRLLQQPAEIARDEDDSRSVNAAPDPVAETSVPEMPVDLETPPLRALDPDALADEVLVQDAPRAFGATMTYGWITDVGQVRDHNEDSVFVFVAEQCSSVTMPPFGLFILADGMGGHHAGEVASAIACQTVAAQLMEHIYLPLLFGDGETAEAEADASGAFVTLMTETVADAIQRANTEVYSSTPGSGTTLTCALLVGRQLFIGHVGDSRAYLRQCDGGIRLLTNDHSMVKQLVDIGQLTPEAAAIHPRRNILYRAVGQGGALPVDVQSLYLDHAAQLLLCTDGLWGLVSDEMLWQIVTSAPSTQAACMRLVETANAAGGNDNITAIIVEFRDGSAVRIDENQSDDCA